jgi:hypothetical protein
MGPIQRFLIHPIGFIASEKTMRLTEDPAGLPYKLSSRILLSYFFINRFLKLPGYGVSNSINSPVTG